MHRQDVFCSVDFCQMCLTDLLFCVFFGDYCNQAIKWQSPCAILAFVIYVHSALTRSLQGLQGMKRCSVVLLHTPAFRFCYCCLNTATVAWFPTSPACGTKGQFLKLEHLKTSFPMRLAVNYEFSVFLCAPSRSCGLSSRWWKRGRRGMFMKTQQTPISLSSGIWCVTLSAILVFCFFYGNTFDVCFNIFQGAHFYLIYFIYFTVCSLSR